MIDLLRPIDAAHVQRVAMCPKCKLEERGDVVPGCLEVERDWILRVKASGVSRTVCLRALRLMPDFAGMSLQDVAKQLDAEFLMVGPLSRASAIQAKVDLEAAGLTVELVAE
jgi:hypothetical protein